MCEMEKDIRSDATCSHLTKHLLHGARSFWQTSCQEYGIMHVRAAELAARGRPMYCLPVLNGWNWG